MTPRGQRGKPPQPQPPPGRAKLVPLRLVPSTATQSLAEVFEALGRDLTPEGRRRMAEDFMHYLRTRDVEEASS